MKIPLPRLMRHHREAEFEAGSGAMSWSYRQGLRVWAAMARRPRLYHLAARLSMAVLGALGRRRGAFRTLPLAGGWTRHRDFPAPQGRTFQQLWREHQAGISR